MSARGPDYYSPEANLRFMAFHVAYGTLFAPVKDLPARFALALEYSLQPIRDRGLLTGWEEWTKGGRFRMERLLDERKEPPAALRPIVDAYRAAAVRREHERSEEIAVEAVMYHSELEYPLDAA